VFPKWGISSCGWLDQPRSKGFVGSEADLFPASRRMHGLPGRNISIFVPPAGQTFEPVDVVGMAEDVVNQALCPAGRLHSGMDWVECGCFTS